MFRAISCTVSAFATVVMLSVPAVAQDTPDAALSDMKASMGSVPHFMTSVSPAALPGLWLEYKQLELSEDTALSPKVKSLISLAVAAQIPCTYCIWADTTSAKQAGATDEEIAEAVAMAGATRNWSTIFNGMQVDFDQFKKDLGGM